MVHAASSNDLEIITDLACLLWPEEDRENMRNDFASYDEAGNRKIFLYKEHGKSIAFIQLSLRQDYVDGSTTSPTGYIEGIYVLPEHRYRRIGRDLINYGEQWCASRGCIEMGCDVELTNSVSQKFHEQCGFIESNRVVMYIKRIADQTRGNSPTNLKK